MQADETVAGRMSGGRAPRRSLWKSPALIATVAVLILVFCSRVVDGWRWPPRAFVVVGALIFGLGFIYQLVTRGEGVAYRAAVAIAFVAGFLLTWSNFVQMADVTPFAAMYFVVPPVGVISAAVARLRAGGMSRALFVTALAQGLVLAAAFFIGMTRHPELASWTPPEWRGLGGNAFLGLLFVASAFLFRRAARG